MKIVRRIRRTVIHLAVIVAVVSATGCTFRPYLRDARDPALAATPPCSATDVCGGQLDSDNFAWTAEAMRTAR